MNPRVAKILKRDFPVLTLQFTNGEIKHFSCEPYLDKGFFRELQNIPYFNQAAVLEGTVVWPHEQDFCPDTLYLEGTKATRPTVEETVKAESCRVVCSVNPKPLSHTPA